MKLYYEGIPNVKIAEQVNMLRSSVHRIVNRELERLSTGKPTREEYIQLLVESRKIMYLDEVSAKFGVSESSISNLTCNHPDAKQFKRRIREYTKKPKPIKQPKPKIMVKSVSESKPTVKKSTSKPKPTIKKKDIKIIDQVDMQKGHAKLQKGETILPNRTPKEQRLVPMYDNKNTIKFIEMDDPRSNEEIRTAWKEEQDKKLKNLSA